MYDFPGYVTFGVKNLMPGNSTVHLLCAHSTVHRLRDSKVFKSVDLAHDDEDNYRLQVFIRNGEEWSKLKKFMDLAPYPMDVSLGG